MMKIRQKKVSPRMAVKKRAHEVPSRRQAATSTRGAEDYDQVVEARRHLMRYLLGVLNDAKALPRRRDEMAFCLSKIVATALPKIGGAPPGRPKTERQPAKPRVSTYVSKKKQADAASKTAQQGSPWNGLINGSAGAHDPVPDDDDDDEDAG